MSKLELFLLGSPQIYLDGQAVTAFNTRKDCALLAYLAVTGTTHSREMLAGLLWSELPEDKARRNLRHTLSHLQKVIGPQWLETERGVALTQTRPWSVDVHTLRATVKSLTTSANVNPAYIDTQALATLDQALQLYRGEFLQGFHIHGAVHFEEWVLAQREELRLLTLRGLEVLVECCLAHAMYDKGLSATRRLLQLEPWSEPAYCLQMQLLAHSGRRAEALAQYETCRQVLATELDVEPLPATTALYQQIKAGKYNGMGLSKPPTLPAGAGPKPPAIQTRAAVKPTVPNNLLTPLAEFVGRQSELDLISRRLGTADCRLLTIVGPGGMGKTRLAHAVGQRLLSTEPTAFPDGIFFVALAGLPHPTPPLQREGTVDDQVGTLLVTTLAERIGCDLQSGLSPLLQLQNYLHQRRLLLILDNFEHLLAAADTVLTLLTGAPKLTVLITSRARLNLRGETVLPLAKLSLPSRMEPITDTESGWQASEAVTMFVQRAQALDPHFVINAANLGPITQICRLVDGLPLGIELATSMLPMFSCTELAQELTQSLAFLQAETRDLPADQRTLRAVFERSWRLLTPSEQTLLARLAIWAGTFDWAAAQMIAEATRLLLLRLINQSLVSSTSDGRYALHPVVRAFALEKLEQTPAQGVAVRIHFAHFYLDFLAQKEPALKGSALATTFAQIYTELDNLRLAWRWAVAYRLHSALLAAMHTLFLFYDLQGLYAEAVEQAESALQPYLADDAVHSLPADPTVNLLIGRLQSYWGAFTIRSGRREQAEQALEAGWARLQHAASPFAMVFCLNAWGSVLRGRDIQQAKALASEAAHHMQAIADGWLNAWVYLNLGEINQLLGDYTEAMAQCTKGYKAAEQTDCAWSLANGQRWLGRLHVLIGDYPTAEMHLRNCLAYAHNQNMKIVWIEANTYLGEALRLQGRLAEAQVCYAESRQQAEALQHKFLLAQAIWGQGSLAVQRREYAAAQALFTESRDKGHPNLWPHLLPTPGWALIGLGELAEAQRYFYQVVTEMPMCQFPPLTLDAQVGLAYLQALGARQAGQALPAESSRVLHDIYHHPAATAETRQRIIRIADELGLRLQEGSRPERSVVWDVA